MNGKEGPPYAIIPTMLPPLRHIAPRLSGRVPAALNFLTSHCGLLACGLFLLAGWFLADDYGPNGWDESSQKIIAQANLDYALGRADRIVAKVHHDRVYGAAFELPLLLAQQILETRDFLNPRPIRFLLTHLFFIVSGWFCYRLACRLFNNRLLALIALLIFLLHPRIYAHAFFNSKDPVFLGMFVIALYLLERAFRRDTPGAFVLLAIAVGLLTNIRIMGAMLFPAVIVLRGLDLLYAGNWPRRRRILLTAGLFLLTAVLTTYALSPYAWTNPVDYLLASLNLTVDHPTKVQQLFQGPWVYAHERPQYTAVWFGITTPPPLLLLGGLGAAVAAAAALRRPGAVFRNTPLRFALLLPTCFLLPPLAAALLGSHHQDAWRHFYFIYVPFCLMAAGGLHWLGSARPARLGRAGAYGLATAALGLTILQMAQIHPFQDIYFNFLVDRTTLERLRTQYRMVSFNVGRPQLALAYLRELHPGETLAIRGSLSILGDQDFPAADYAVFSVGDGGHPDLAFNALPVGRIYNNTVLAVKPLTAARMTPAAIAAYREIQRQALAGPPIIRSPAYNVYLRDRTLTFIRENCSWGDRERRVFVKLFANPDSQNNLAVFLRSYGVRLGDTCLAVVQLPDYVQGDLLIGQDQELADDWGGFVRLKVPIQSVGEAHSWEELHILTRPGLGERIAMARRKNRQPALRAVFDVFLEQDADGRQRLLYAKADCSAEEYQRRVALHIYPANPAHFPGQEFEHRDFHLARYGGRPGGDCLAAVPLPDYPIRSLRTGQAGSWSGSLYPPADPAPLRQAYAALSAAPPDHRADFDLYWQDGQLTYIRESCAAADTAERFFLHIFPADADLLAGPPPPPPPPAQDNQDFDFGWWGGHFDGKCLATVPLPDYPIAALSTGQFLRSQGRLWAADLTAPADLAPLRAAYAALPNGQFLARSRFDLYVRDNRLVYVRETCAAADTAALFFLYIIPENPAALTVAEQADGRAWLGFAFPRRGGHFDGKCLAAVPLPDYPIKEIHTGQYVPGQGPPLWLVELAVEW